MNKVVDSGRDVISWQCASNPLKISVRLIAAAAHNLGLLMRVLFKMGTPRGLQAAADIAWSMYLAILTLCKRILRPEFALQGATASYPVVNCR